MKEIKPLILTWLAKAFNYENYPHSFRDQFITWGIDNRVLSVGFDFRCEEQMKLVSLIPSRFFGTPQYGTLKIVNERNFYLDLKNIIDLKYPKIIRQKLIAKVRHDGGSGGWTSPSDIFYTWHWEVLLDDNTSIPYKTFEDKKFMEKGDFQYLYEIHERCFINFLKNLT